MTKEFIDSIVKQLKEYVDAKLRSWGLSDEEKSLVAFEQKYMPYTRYSGEQSVDHVLFRKFLRVFNPDAIREAAKGDLDKKQDKVDNNLKTTNNTVVGAINELRDAISVSGGGDKEVIEVENEDALDQIEEPSNEVIYITADTGQLYIYDGDKFINVTNKQVGNTIYVFNIKDLIGREYENGLYTVETIDGKMYNLNVYGLLFHKLRLYNHNGWAEVATNEDGEKYWKWHRYTYEGHTHTTQDVIGLAEVIEEVTSKKQDKDDNNLETSNKTVVGAINEVLGRVDAAYHSFTVDFQESREVVQMRTVAGAINIERIMADNIATLKLHVNGNAQTISLRDGVWNGLITIPSDALFVWNVGRITEGEIASISVKYNF